MPIVSTLWRVLAAVTLAFLISLVAVPAFAQTSPQPLPTAPGASKAADGGLTGAAASLPGENGSPLEPYLYLMILAGGGILAGVAMSIVDRQVRASRTQLRTIRR